MIDTKLPSWIYSSILFSFVAYLFVAISPIFMFGCYKQGDLDEESTPLVTLNDNHLLLLAYPKKHLRYDGERWTVFWQEEANEYELKQFRAAWVCPENTVYSAGAQKHSGGKWIPTVWRLNENQWNKVYSP